MQSDELFQLLLGASKTMPDLSSLATPVPSSVPSPANFRTTPGTQEPQHSFGSFYKAAGHVRSQSLTVGECCERGDFIPCRHMEHSIEHCHSLMCLRISLQNIVTLRPMVVNGSIV